MKILQGKRSLLILTAANFDVISDIGMRCINIPQVVLNEGSAKTFDF